MGYNRKTQENERLKKLYSKTKTFYCCGVWYDDRKKRYIRYSKSDIGNTKYLKRQTSKKIRNNKLVIPKNSYRKVYDFWWELT